MVVRTYLPINGGEEFSDIKQSQKNKKESNIFHVKGCITGGSAELARYTFEQLNVKTPNIFYDTISDKIVSVDYGGTDLSEFNKDKIDETTFWKSLALKSLLNDSDVHGESRWENIQVTESGEVYPIDFGYMGKNNEGTIEHILESGADFLQDKYPNQNRPDSFEEANLEIRDRAFDYAKQVDIPFTAQKLGSMFDFSIKQDRWEWRNVYDEVFTNVEKLQNEEWPQ